MIRPSALQIAEHCGLAPVLAEQFPESSEAAARGTAIHALIADVIDRELPLDGLLPEVRHALEFVERTFGPPCTEQLRRVEQKAKLKDPETGELITAGTADFVVFDRGTKHMTVIDWKTGRPENVASAWDNLQAMAYALACAMESEAASLSWGIVFLDSMGATPDMHGPVLDSDWWEPLRRVTAAAGKPPEATPGPHCGSCYSRAHCPTWRDNARTALVSMSVVASADIDSTEAGGTLALNDETAAILAVRRDAAAKALEIVDAILRAHVTGGGKVSAGGKAWGPTLRSGRTTPDIEALRAAGVTVPMKTGAPYEVWAWRKEK